MMTYTIRKGKKEDTPEWIRLREALWPGTSRAEHEQDGEAIWEKHLDAAVYLAFDEKGKAVGFAEVFLRGFANGCDTSPLAFLEGIWVDPLARGKGVGRRLVEAVSAWGREMGMKELGSDALIDNKASHIAHKAWGFEETEKVVYFRMKL